MKRFHPDIIYIENEIANSGNVRRILKNLPNVPVEIIENYQKQGNGDLSYNSRFQKEKKGLILAQKKGELVKQVERDLFRKIPNEFYIIHSQGCPFDCQYCFLYDYLDHQIPTVFVNLEDILASVEQTIALHPGERLTFHTGEFSDALAFDHITNLSQPLIELFANYNYAFLELRTKTDQIENLLGLKHNGQSIVSWTFSPQKVMQLFEFHTSSAMERIRAAKKCQEAGYSVALRLDPLIFYPCWESDYRELIELIAQHLDPSFISDCHLGVFRYTPGLGKVIRQRFPRSELRLQESVLCQDGKYRYLKHLRLEMYRKIIIWLREAMPSLKIELCMESLEVEEALQPTLSNSFRAS